MVELLLNRDLIWCSDWAGDEVSHLEAEHIGLYGLKDTNIFFYIDMDLMKIVDAWEMKEDE